MPARSDTYLRGAFRYDRAREPGSAHVRYGMHRFCQVRTLTGPASWKDLLSQKLTTLIATVFTAKSSYSVSHARQSRVAKERGEQFLTAGYSSVFLKTHSAKPRS